MASEPDQAPVLRVDSVSKRFGSVPAVENVGFTVFDGEVVGLLGPNGAGKTTILSIITGYLSATSGSVQINGTNILDDPMGARRTIGYLPEVSPVYPEMVISDYLRFVGRIKRVEKDSLPDTVGKAAAAVGINDVVGRRIGNLSKGYRQRLGLAQALIGDPELLILDEPTSGLDPRQIVETREMIATLGRTRTVIVSSHLLSEISTICDRVIIINKGRLVMDDSLRGITARARDIRTVALVVAADRETTESILWSVAGVQDVSLLDPMEPDTTEVTVTAQPEIDIREAVFRRFAEKGVALLGMRTRNATLEEVFLDLTERTRNDA